MLPFDMPSNFLLLLKAEHDVLDKRNGSKAAFGDVVVRCGGRGGSLCCPRVRSQPFSEPVILAYELHKCPEGAGVEFSPFPEVAEALTKPLCIILL